MLNTIPSPILPRRRGAQPSNHNALKTGLYARQHLGPFELLAQAIPAPHSPLFADSEIFDQVVLALRVQIASLFEASQKAAGLRSILTWHRAILHGITLLKQVIKARQRYLQPQEHLQFIAAHALDLIRYDFGSFGVTRDAYSFREKILKSDLNSPATPQDVFPSPSGSHHLFLTPIQCQVLGALLPSLNLNDGRALRMGSPLSKSAGFGEGPGVRLICGRPPASPLPLLDAIFWKIAHHARWQDLPAGSPPMLTCRRYNSRLFRSGRLLTLYAALYQDLLTRGHAVLTVLVNQGCFAVSGSQVDFPPAPNENETWQVRTALLFLQPAHTISRRILREDAHDHPRAFPHFRP